MYRGALLSVIEALNTLNSDQPCGTSVTPKPVPPGHVHLFYPVAPSHMLPLPTSGTKVS